MVQEACHSHIALLGIVPATGSWLLSSCDIHSEILPSFRAPRERAEDAEAFRGIKFVKANCLGNSEAKQRERDVTGREKVTLQGDLGGSHYDDIQVLCPSQAPVFTWSPAGGGDLWKEEKLQEMERSWGQYTTAGGLWGFQTNYLCFLLEIFASSSCKL